ncbi:hypothetical protein L210DRAFT_2560588 [Boletus edulis BED1]|uniref:Uncharacterized protein n=1 Tax=Boletus edulis BED1 TaxID=1328754 RepID=A0AAD4BB71_BOLED|nr:hypothetical protein L210DRAFT_2560588 [Boletus edulis BED1]
MLVGRMMGQFITVPDGTMLVRPARLASPAKPELVDAWPGLGQAMWKRSQRLLLRCVLALLGVLAIVGCLCWCSVAYFFEVELGSESCRDKKYLGLGHCTSSMHTSMGTVISLGVANVSDIRNHI